MGNANSNQNKSHLDSPYDVPNLSNCPSNTESVSKEHSILQFLRKDKDTSSPQHLTLSMIGGSSSSCTSVSSLDTTKSTAQSTTSNFDIDCPASQNGVTGIYISQEVADTASLFWRKNVFGLTQIDKLELGCAIFFTMRTDDSIKKLLVFSPKHQLQIEKLSLKFNSIDLSSNSIDLFEVLRQLGQQHTIMGVNTCHFGIMLSAIHESLAYYLSNNYTVQVRYALDTIFSVATQIMTGADMSNYVFHDETFKDFDFLKSLSKCLSDPIGQQYLWVFLKQKYNEELIIYLQLISKFNVAMNDKQRYVIASEIVKTCIESESPFAINVSCELRQQTLSVVRRIEQENKFDGVVLVSKHLFRECTKQVHQLIRLNHWSAFVRSMCSLH